MQRSHITSGYWCDRARDDAPLWYRSAPFASASSAQPTCGDGVVGKIQRWRVTYESHLLTTTKPRGDGLVDQALETAVLGAVDTGAILARIATIEQQLGIVG